MKSTLQQVWRGKDGRLKKWAIWEVGGSEEKSRQVVKNNRESRGGCFKQKQIGTTSKERWTGTLYEYTSAKFLQGNM